MGRDRTAGLASTGSGVIWLLACEQTIQFEETAVDTDTVEFCPSWPDASLEVETEDVWVEAVPEGETGHLEIQVVSDGEVAVEVTGVELDLVYALDETARVTGACAADGLLEPGCVATVEVEWTSNGGPVAGFVYVRSTDSWRSESVVQLHSTVTPDLRRHYVEWPLLGVRYDASAVWFGGTVKVHALNASTRPGGTHYQWAADESGMAGTFENTSATDATWIAPSEAPGACEIVANTYVVATDADGNQTWAFREIEVRAHPTELRDREPPGCGHASGARSSLAALALAATLGGRRRRAVAGDR